jgi:hypothetical protein
MNYNASKFTDEEMDFLLNTVKRGVILTEVDRIDLHGVSVKTTQKYFKGKYVNYLSDSINYITNTINKESSKEFKERIIRAIIDSDDFAFECYSDSYGDSDDSCTLVTYNYVNESDELFLKRIETEGYYLLQEEIKRARKRAKENTRIVLFEKYKKKKVGRPKKVLA